MNRKELVRIYKCLDFTASACHFDGNHLPSRATERYDSNQKSVGQRWARHSDPKRFGAERQKLFLSVQRIVLPKYGFDAGPKAQSLRINWTSVVWDGCQGVFDMLEQFDRSDLVMNSTFQQQAVAFFGHLVFPQTALELNGVLNSSKKQVLFHHHFRVLARVPGLVSLLFWHPVPSSFPGSC